MRVIKYQVDIYDNAPSWAPGFGETIEEIFIPEKGISFNINSGRLNVFKANERRGKGEEINVNDTLVDEPVNLFKLKEKCYKSAQVHFKDEARIVRWINC